VHAFERPGVTRNRDHGHSRRDPEADQEPPAVLRLVRRDGLGLGQQLGVQRVLVLAAADELMTLLASIANPFEREQVMNRFASSVGITTQVLQDLYRRRQRGTMAVPKTKTEIQRIPEPERQILRIFLTSTEIAALVFPEMEELDFEEFVFVEDFRNLEKKVLSNETDAVETVLQDLPSESQNFLTSLMLDQEAPAPTVEDARHWLHASNPSERWKWDFMFQDLPPIKFGEDFGPMPRAEVIPLKEVK
jgi:hypothetical protein